MNIKADVCWDSLVEPGQCYVHLLCQPWSYTRFDVWIRHVHSNGFGAVTSGFLNLYDRFSWPGFDAVLVFFVVYFNWFVINLFILNVDVVIFCEKFKNKIPNLNKIAFLYYAHVIHRHLYTYHSTLCSYTAGRILKKLEKNMGVLTAATSWGTVFLGSFGPILQSKKL
jgi:hypothetical protein